MFVLSIQVVVHTKDGQRLYRISPWAVHVTKEDKSVIYDWVHWDPPQPYLVRCNFYEYVHFNCPIFRTRTFFCVLFLFHFDVYASVETTVPQLPWLDTVSLKVHDAESAR